MEIVLSELICRCLLARLGSFSSSLLPCRTSKSAYTYEVCNQVNKKLFVCLVWEQALLAVMYIHLQEMVCYKEIVLSELIFQCLLARLA